MSDVAEMGYALRGMLEQNNRLKRELAEARECAAEALHVLEMHRATAMQNEADVSMAKVCLKRITAKAREVPDGR